MARTPTGRTPIRPPRTRGARALALPARPLPVTALLALLLALAVTVSDQGGLPAAVTLAATAATTAAGAALAVCALITARAVPAVPPTRVRTALRERRHRTAFLPQRDPDAAGRSRPRAPGRALPATTTAA
ncbi:DUF6412 domain-containing protein [Streptomyces sp. NPDC048664]|uniref:DUF6412 domain-containing protein n=1 Tax=Streptomyces sp. NPDC048664 TaxID=3154505 RepID=UPI003436CC30